MGISPVRKVRLIRVPLNHRGTTKYLLSEALTGLSWPDYSSLLYLCPTAAKAREAQKSFHRLVSHPYIPPRFLTIKQFAMDLFTREAAGRHLPRLLVPILISELSGQGMGYATVLADLLRELKQHRPSVGIGRIHQDLTGIFLGLGIPEDARRTMDAAMAVFRSYQEDLSRAGYHDDDDILAYAAAAAEGRGPDCSVLIADGFTDMTVVEQSILAALAMQAGSALITRPDASAEGLLHRGHDLGKRLNASEERLPASAQQDLSYVAYAGVEEELEGIARHIRNLHAVRGQAPSGQTIVTAPSLRRHLPLLRRVFRRYGVPYGVAAGLPALSRPAMRDIFSLLDAVSDDFPRLAFTGFLSSPFFRGLRQDFSSMAPSLSLRSGIIKGRGSWAALSSSCQDREAAGRIDEGLRSVFGILDELVSMRDGVTASALFPAVEEALGRLGFDSGDDTIAELRDAMGLAHRVDELSGGRPLPLKRHIEHLRHILMSSEYHAEDAPVRLMDFGETRGLEPDRLYFCGLKDGALPSKPAVDFVLPDSVRSAYGLLTFRGSLALQKLDFLRLCGASADLHLSCPAVEGDRVNLPSPFLPWGGEKKEQVFGVFSEAELQSRQGGRRLADSISEIRIDARTRDRISRRELAMPLRVTDIDAFRRCPRRFFIERVLRLEASEVAEYEVEARLLGTLVHQIMERLLLVPMTDPEAVRSAAEGIAREVMSGAPVDPYWRSLIKTAFVEMLPRIMEQESELRSEGFLPDQLEMKVEERLMPGISLKGKVDRIDRREALFRLIDYKTGSADIGSGIIRKGKDLQLPLYAAMLRARGMQVEKAGIYSLKEIGIQWIPTKRDRHTLDDYIQAATAYLGETVDEMRAGRFRAAPMEENVCSSCPEAPFCPYIQARGADNDV